MLSPQDSAHTLNPAANSLDASLTHLRLESLANPSQDRLAAITGQFSVWSETGPLKHVIIGDPVSGVNYDPAAAPGIDRQTRHTQQTGAFISAAQAVREFALLKEVLRSHGVVVASPQALQGALHQIYTRDIGMVIGDTFVPAVMAKKEERAIELAALATLLRRASKESAHIMCCNEPGATFEGGDIIVHEGKLFVGLTERTNRAGVNWLERTFPKLTIVPMEIVRPSNDAETLHLDCAFAQVGDAQKGAVLISREWFSNYDSFKHHFAGKEIIRVSPEEQAMLGTNVLSINPQHIIIRDRCERLIKRLANLGFTPIPLQFDAAKSLGGLFRCCSLPIVRA